jgi:uncharacterized protein (UPF0248 family)
VIPIHELLNRIRWDAEFSQGRFAIGYYDRVADRVSIVPFEEIGFEPGDHFAFLFIDADGETHSVPLHRIRDVYKDGARIWHREGHHDA